MRIILKWVRFWGSPKENHYFFSERTECFHYVDDIEEYIENCNCRKPSKDIQYRDVQLKLKNGFIETIGIQKGNQLEIYLDDKIYVLSGHFRLFMGVTKQLLPIKYFNDFLIFLFELDSEDIECFLEITDDNFEPLLKVNELIEARELQLLKNSGVKLDKLRSQISDEESFDKLMEAVEIATQKNESTAELKSRIFNLGEAVIEVVKEVLIRLS